MRRTTDNLSFEVVEVPAPKGSFEDLLDLIVDLLIRKWIEDQKALKIRE